MRAFQSVMIKRNIHTELGLFYHQRMDTLERVNHPAFTQRVEMKNYGGASDIHNSGRRFIGKPSNLAFMQKRQESNC